MNPTRAHRRLALGLVVILALISMLALTGIASAKSRTHHGSTHHRKKHRHLSMSVAPAPSPLVEPGGTPEAGEDEGEPAEEAEDTEGEAGEESESSEEQQVEGTVVSFEGSTLTIELASGGTLSGQVTESTEIECEQAETAEEEDGQASEEEEQSSEDEGQSEEEDQSNAPEEEDQSSTCTSAALVPGAVVQEAELETTPEGATFQSIDLAG